MWPDATVNTWMRSSTASAGTPVPAPASAGVPVLPAQDDILPHREPLSPAPAGAGIQPGSSWAAGIPVHGTAGMAQGPLGRALAQGSALLTALQ